MKNLLFCFVAVAALFTACKKEDCNEIPKILKGPEVKIRDGKAWTWVEINKEATPTKVVITINDAALNSIQYTQDGGGHQETINDWVLKFHPMANISPFNHVGLGWNPMGHEPEPIYGKPHFDMHFFMISPSAVDAIPSYEQDSLKFKNWPDAAYFPAHYFNAGGGVPRMGAHWVDLSSGEFNGLPFDQTFVFGSYNGFVNFYEPMITLLFLQTHNNFSRTIPQPAKFQKSGWYPANLIIQKHDGVTDIILANFTLKVAS